MESVSTFLNTTFNLKPTLISFLLLLVFFTRKLRSACERPCSILVDFWPMIAIRLRSPEGGQVSLCLMIVLSVWCSGRGLHNTLIHWASGQLWSDLNWQRPGLDRLECLVPGLPRTHLVCANTGPTLTQSPTSPGYTECTVPNLLQPTRHGEEDKSSFPLPGHHNEDILFRYNRKTMAVVIASWKPGQSERLS